MNNTIVKCLFIVGLAVGLSACFSKSYNESSHKVMQTQHKIETAQVKQDRSQPAVLVKKGYYVDTNPVDIPTTPKWLRTKVTLQAKDIPFGVLMSRLLRKGNANVTYDNTISTGRLINFNYHGSLAGALKAVAAKTDYAYRISGREVGWSAFEDRTFNISFMPGTSNYMVGQDKATEGSSGSSGGGTASSGENGNQSLLNNDEYSNMKGELSVWQDLRRTLHNLKSKDGQVIVSESTTSVMVHDHPRNVKAMTRYIKKLNKMLSEEVNVKVQVLQVELDKDSNNGIDWNAVAKDVFGTNIRLRGNLGSATDLVATNVVRSGGNGVGAALAVGRTMQTVIKALQRQGKVRVVTKPEVVTMNNQIAAIRIVKNTGYVKSVSSTITGTTGLITTAITPGEITDGFTLYLLPKIQGNKVFLQLSSTLSNLLALQKIEAGGTTSGASSNQSNVIEVPTVAEKSFNQRSVIQSGSTLIIAGYKQLGDKAEQAALFGLPALGGYGTKSSNVETLVMITPTILHQG